MADKQNMNQFKELFFTTFVATTMVLFAFTSCQSKDEKAVIQYTKKQQQEVTYRHALKYFGINRPELAEQMTNYIIDQTQIEVVNHSVKTDKTVFTLKMNLIDGDELQSALKLFAQNQEKYNFDKMSFTQAMQELAKVEGRPLAFRESFIKISMQNNIHKELSIEGTSGDEKNHQMQLSRDIEQTHQQKRTPASIQKNK